MGRRVLPHLLVWSSFYEMLAWTPLLILLATAAGDPSVVALAASTYSAANLLGNLGFGLLADKLQRYRVAGAGLLAMAGTAALHLTVTAPAALVGVRFLHGLAAAAVAPAAFALVTDGAPAGRRGESMARVGLIIAVASMMAPPISGRLARGAGVPAAVLALVGMLALFGLLTLAVGKAASGARPMRRLPEPSPLAAGSHGETDRLNPWMMAFGGTVAFALMFGQNVLFYALPLRGSQLGMGPAEIGGVLGVFAVGAFIAFVPPLSRLADRRGRRMPMLLGLALTAAGLLALAQSDARGAMSASLFLYGLGFGLVFPAVSAVSADGAGHGRRGLGFGVLTASFSLGAVAGPLVASAVSPLASPFAVAATVAVAGLGISAFMSPRPRPVIPPAGPGA